MWFIAFLFLAALGFAAYAAFTHYTSTDPGQPVLKRVWTAVLLTGGALALAFSQWLSGLAQ